MSSIFSKIVRGEISSYKIAEDDHYLAFLDVFPLAVGAETKILFPSNNPNLTLSDCGGYNFSLPCDFKKLIAVSGSDSFSNFILDYNDQVLIHK